MHILFRLSSLDSRFRENDEFFNALLGQEKDVLYHEAKVRIPAIVNTPTAAS